MSNKNYINGANRERRIKKALEKRDMFVIRSSGSHTKIDLVALDLSKGIIHFIQVKPRSMSNQSKTRLQSTISFIERDWVGKAHVISLAKEITA
jgi:Holliday junction resolvase